MTAENFSPELGKPYDLPQMDAWPKSVHLFDEECVWAVKTALAANRPLLISGEPGIGKSQLPRAVAAFFQVPFLPFVVNARSECSHLLYESDPVSRLAQAQVIDQSADENWRDLLAEERFVRPGPLWWAFNWTSARMQAQKWCRVCGADGKPSEGRECCEACYEPSHKHLAGWRPGEGCVVLIDEIDKADSEFPNGLLESLGNVGFDVIPARQPVTLEGRPPLVAITSNQERELPAAFIRRCLVLTISFPPDPKTQSPAEFLVERGRVHFGGAIHDDVYTQAAGLIVKERERQKDALHRPGAAEYLDILRALEELYRNAPDPRKEQLAALEKVARFSLRKQPGGMLL
jgi:MoxR-like ATPase